MSHSSVNVAKVAKAATNDQKQVFRLSDMEVEEVSLVDRAANKKRFITVKREDPMTVNAKEITPNGKGGFTTQAKAGASCGAGVDDKKKKPMGKAALEVPPGFKEAAGPLLDKAVAKIEELAASLKGSKPAEIGDDTDALPGVPAEFATGLAGVCGLLEKIGTMWPAAPAEAEEPAEDTDGGDAPPEPTEMQLRATEKALINGVALLKRTDVKKIGAKMSKDRYTRLQQAAQVLTNLIGELAPAAGDVGGAAGAPEVPQLGKAKAKPGDEKKAPPGDMKKMLDEALAPFGQAIDTMAKGIGQLATHVAKQDKEITKIKKSRDLPNSLTAEGETVQKADESDETGLWSLDMNNPIKRDTVSKTESFFDVNDD